MQFPPGAPDRTPLADVIDVGGPAGVDGTSKSRLSILMMTRGVVPIAPGCGGAELVAYQLARSLASQGHSVTLLSEVVDIDTRDLPTLDVVAPDSGPRDLAQRLPGRFPRLLGEHLAGNLAVV
ncbi:MAG: hypothetical protein QOD76_1772, partial [Solirubrobacteraceae bacterium]|nr:hypothetical protein [Solirubrobacteraceae bacterium]